MLKYWTNNHKTILQFADVFSSNDVRYLVFKQIVCGIKYLFIIFIWLTIRLFS